MRNSPIIAVASSIVLTTLLGGEGRANFIRPLTEAEALTAANLAVIAEVEETDLTLGTAHYDRFVDERGVLNISGFNNPCIRARVLERMKGGSSSTIHVCTPLMAEHSQLPRRGRRVRMYLYSVDDVWLEVPGSGFRER